ncbi:MAG: cell division protein FtsA, partial [Rikenellaceae bacterium]
MEHNKYGVAIDIGASKVTVLVGEQREEGRIKILSGAFVPLKPDVIKRGEIENVNDVTVALRKALQTIENEDNIKVNKATVGITGLYVSCDSKQESVYVKISDEISDYDLEALAENVRRIKPKNGCSVIEIIPLEYSVDGKPSIENPLGASGNKLTGCYNIVYGDDAKLNLLKRAVARAGVEVVDIVPFSFAAAAAVLSEEDIELGVCLVDFGATTIEIAIFQDKKLRFTATLPYGAALLNNDIKSYGILQRSVESLKVQYGSAMPEYTPDDVAIEIPSISSARPKTIPQRTLSRIIEARMIEVIKGIKEVINGSGYANRLPEGVVLTGGGAKLTNMDRLFRKISTYDTRIGIPDVRVDGIDNDIIFDTRYS